MDGQILLWCCVIVFPVRGYSHLQESIRNWRLLVSPNHQAAGNVPFMNDTIPDQANQTRALFAGLAADHAVTATERPLVTEFVSGIGSLQLPETIDIESVDPPGELPAGSRILRPNEVQQRALLQPGRNTMSFTNTPTWGTIPRSGRRSSSALGGLTAVPSAGRLAD